MSEPQVLPRTLHPRKKKLKIILKEWNIVEFKKWHNFFLHAVGFQTCVPRLCALKGNAYFPYPVKQGGSFVYNYPLKRYTVFPNYLRDARRTRDMGTSFFTPLWQIECTSLAPTAIKENDNFLCGISDLCPQALRFKRKCLFPLPRETRWFLCLQLPTQALYSFPQLLARCSKD